MLIGGTYYTTPNETRDDVREISMAPVTGPDPSPSRPGQEVEPYSVDEVRAILLAVARVLIELGGLLLWRWDSTGRGARPAVV